METEKIKSIAESLLFFAGEQVKIKTLAKIIGASVAETENALMMLEQDYASGRGLTLTRLREEVQINTHPDCAEYIEKMSKQEIQQGLSKAAVEVLSIVAYRGPITRSSIEAIRGVNCSYTLRSLLMRGLVERLENPSDSRGYIYQISFDFLRKLGLNRPEDLPDFADLSRDKRVDSILNSQ